jgi:pilus assembly protein CpaB
VPAGLQEVSVLLEPQRAIGGRLAAGDNVGVVISLTFQDGRATTHSVVHDVLVTQVQGAPVPVESDAAGTETASSGSVAPTQSLMVTLAVTAAQAEAVVFGVEHGTLWLSLENEDADTSGTSVLDQSTIYTKDLA